MARSQGQCKLFCRRLQSDFCRAFLSQRTFTEAVPLPARQEPLNILGGPLLQDSLCKRLCVLQLALQEVDLCLQLCLGVLLPGCRGCGALPHLCHFLLKLLQGHNPTVRPESSPSA